MKRRAYSTIIRVIAHMMGDCLWGLFWALVVLLTLFVHYTMCIDVPEFRYIGF
ncbi:MAG: hypothetical protein JW765_11685 [Deltaproteobacteria bacterium]|nr:hypothetical protein [Candidatus Zymogenaceae bacterium]